MLPPWGPDDSGVRSLAVMSDVHCNLTALQACLADLEGLRQAHGHSYELAFLGDVVDTGPSPVATLDLAVAASSCHIRGNHEVYLSECARGLFRKKYASRHWRYVPWTLAQLGEDRFSSYERLLRDECHVCDGRVRYVHASPDSCDKPPAFFGYDAAAWHHEVSWTGRFRRATFCGHTHLGAVYERPDGEVWVNTGSVGYPFLGKNADESYRPYASYVLGLVHEKLGQLYVRIRRVPYDREGLLGEYARADVLRECAPFSRAVFLQSVLNRSVVYQAIRTARKLGVQPEADGVFLEKYLQQEGLEDELGKILSM